MLDRFPLPGRKWDIYAVGMSSRGYGNCVDVIFTISRNNPRFDYIMSTLQSCTLEDLIDSKKAHLGPFFI